MEVPMWTVLFIITIVAACCFAAAAVLLQPKNLPR
jgi:hypothetical protein